MTKEGEGKERFREISLDGYHKDLEKQASKFLKALEQYERETDYEKRTIFKASMNDCLGLMEAAAKELNRDGIRKHLSYVEKDYKIYLEDENLTNLMALREDLSILRTHNQFP